MVSEPKNIRLRDREVAYLLKRSQQRRRIVLSVDEHGLTVSAPWKSSERRIVDVIRDAEAWVLKKLDQWSAFPARRQTWEHGDKLRYLGRELDLHLLRDPVATLVSLQDGDRILVSMPEPDDKTAVTAAIVRWYRRHALSNFTGRIAAFAPRFDLAVPRLFLSSARTRWGSCNASREVRLNWRLIQAAQCTIDYVVVHELAHLIEMNHSKRFWKLVESLCPHYRESCDELTRMGLYYMDI